MLVAPSRRASVPQRATGRKLVTPAKGVRELLSEASRRIAPETADSAGREAAVTRSDASRLASERSPCYGAVIQERGVSRKAPPRSYHVFSLGHYALGGDQSRLSRPQRPFFIGFRPVTPVDHKSNATAGAYLRAPLAIARDGFSLRRSHARSRAPACLICTSSRSRRSLEKALAGSGLIRKRATRISSKLRSSFRQRFHGILATAATSFSQFADQHRYPASSPFLLAQVSPASSSPSMASRLIVELGQACVQLCIGRLLLFERLAESSAA